MQQFDPELLLEQSYLPAKGGLGDMELLGRPGEVALLGHRHEVLQPTKIGHPPTLSPV